MSLRDWLRQRRARKEAAALVRQVRRQVRRHGYRLSPEVATEVKTATDSLDKAQRAKDHDAVCSGLVTVDELADRHLSFARKSTFREYADSIAVAVLFALLLRAFVVEAFKIPSGSMIPTMQVGDHIFVNKFVYGLRIPFTKIKFFEWRKPKRGEVIVFIYPKDPDKDFIKRIVGVEGDKIEVKDNLVYVNDKPVHHERLPGISHYWDYDELTNRWSEKVAKRFEEELDGEKYTTIEDPNGEPHDFPGPGDENPYIVPKDTVFVLGDNRNNSRDSRYWGPVPLENIKGKALVVWWSSGGPEGVRWGRLGKLVD